MSLAGLRPIAVWRETLSEPDSALAKEMTELYGDASLIAGPMDLLQRCIDAFADAYGGEREVFVIRSTGHR